MIVQFKDRWNSFIETLPNPTLSKKWQEKLVEYYTEPHRFYHNYNHILDCLDQLEQVKNSIDQEMELTLAIWFHDIVYNTRSRNNEKDSAIIARQFCKEIGISKESTELIGNLIENTSEHNESRIDAFSFMNDIDLSILGRESKEFVLYESNIRQEYHWVPLKEFQEKRGEILNKFLSRTRIYTTDYFFKAYEQKARENLIALLEGYTHYTLT